MGELRVMGREGDTRMTWDRGNADEVESVRAMFNDLRRRGHLAYSVEEGGGRGEVVREFDPNAQKVILAPPMAGG